LQVFFLTQIEVIKFCLNLKDGSANEATSCSAFGSIRKRKSII
jgi:hypothetical protein